MKLFQLLCILLFLIFTGYVSSTTYYVSIFGSDRNNGLSASSPFLTLQQCENVAKNGDIIQLLPGVFEGYQNCIEWDKSNVTLIGPSSIACAGGLSGENHDMVFRNISFLSVSGYVTSCTFSGANFAFESCYFKVSLDFYTTQVNISHSHFSTGVTIYHSVGSIYISNCLSEGSGYFSSYSSALTFKNNTFSSWGFTSNQDLSFVSNHTTFGGMEIQNLGSYTYWGEQIPSNFGTCAIDNAEVSCSSSNYGIYLDKSNCSFHNLKVHSCVASYTSPASAVILYYSSSNFSSAHIYNNYGNSAMFVDPYSNVTVTHSTFQGNVGNSTTTGGGLHVAGYATVLDTLFEGNLAYDGGAFFLANDATIFLGNTTIQNNTAYYAGAYDCAPNAEPGSITLANCKVTDNTNISGEGDICPTA